MKPGFYVVRLSINTTGIKLIVESIAFSARIDADNWCEFIKSEHSKDNVFVIEKCQDEH